MTERTLLLAFTGVDHPGITTAIFDVISKYKVEVLDLGQVVIRGRLTLGTLVSAPDPAAEIELRDALGEVSRQMGCEFFVQSGDDQDEVKESVHVTILGASLKPHSIKRITEEIAGLGANIEKISRIASFPVIAIELFVSGTSVDELRHQLGPVSKECGVDIAVQNGGLARHSKRLVMLDVDSTLIQGEVIELLAERAGSGAKVREITMRVMAGELDFSEALRERVGTLAGLTRLDLEAVVKEIRLTPGARTLIQTLRGLGLHTGVVSGGFIEIVKPLAESLGIEFVRANQLEIIDGVLTGRIVGDIIDRAGKAQALKDFAAELGIPLSQTVAIGDGANDLDMIEVAGLGIAFNAKPVVVAAADTAISLPYLDSVLYLLGISPQEITSFRDA